MQSFAIFNLLPRVIQFVYSPDSPMLITCHSFSSSQNGLVILISFSCHNRCRKNAKIAVRLFWEKIGICKNVSRKAKKKRAIKFWLIQPPRLVIYSQRRRIWLTALFGKQLLIDAEALLLWRGCPLRIRERLKGWKWRKNLSFFRIFKIRSYFLENLQNLAWLR